MLDSKVYVGGFSSFIASLKRHEGIPWDDYNLLLKTSDWADFRDTSIPYGTRDSNAAEAFLLAAGRRALIGKHGNALISVVGSCLDTIEVITKPRLSDSDIVFTFQDWYRAVAENVLAQRKYNSLITTGFLRTISVDIIHGDNATPFRRHEHFHFSDLPRARPGNFVTYFDDTSILEKAMFSNNAFRIATYRRSLFITKSGRLGLGPENIRPGDHLCILLGSKTPFILRNANRPVAPPTLDRHAFELIGDCYADGLMNGEAMRGWQEMSVQDANAASYLRALVDEWYEVDKDASSSWKKIRQRGLEKSIQDCRPTRRGYLYLA